MNKRPVVMPFLNEGVEVERTVQNIRQTAGNNVDILLINDASQDNTDYEKVAQAYNTRYIKNEIRRGVARSRDIGVSMIDTPYFILMDAHMRFYKNDWWKKITKYLEKDDRAVYCLKCLILDQEAKIIKDRYGTGAYINLYDENYGTVLDSYWITSSNSAVFDIPCVLGASYIMSKRYWDYIRGLSLLRYYGLDETYLSLKIWLEGGSCKLIPNIEAGHIFRGKAPYRMVYTDTIFNKLLIVETVLPDDYARYVHVCMKQFNQKEYFFALSLLNRQKHEIMQLKEYYRSIFTKDFEYFKKLNSKYYKSVPQAISVNINPDFRLDKIALALTRFQPEQSGLMTGRMGLLLFLCEYREHLKDEQCKKDAEQQIITLLDTVLEDIKNRKIASRNITTGLAGTGAGLICLQNRGYISPDISETLDYIDREVLEFANEMIKQQNFGYLQGATGAGYYLLHRDEAKFSQFLNCLIPEIEQAFSYGKILINMSHGILGILQFLTLAYRRNKVDKPGIREIIRKLTDRILSCEQDFEKAGYYFPENSDDIQKTGLMWQSGDLITGYVLLNASEILEDSNLHDKSMQILRSTSGRLDPVHEYVWDAGFYNGSSGLAYMYYKLYKQTGDAAFHKSCAYWLAETLYKAVADNDSAGYTACDSSSRENSFGLFAGIAGTGLSLLSIENGTDLSDEIFML
ncbi:MAG: glycosyltransferase [Prevotellaceae bacterium]|jgi:glycosyltransferase involved in cell wall biosynthesis|nr:glycosyltransferase [Prevotellaceae bacterium]